MDRERSPAGGRRSLGAARVDGHADVIGTGLQHADWMGDSRCRGLAVRPGVPSDAAARTAADRGTGAAMSPSPAVGAMLGAVLALGAGLIWVSIPARRQIGRAHV